MSVISGWKVSLEGGLSGLLIIKNVHDCPCGLESFSGQRASGIKRVTQRLV